MAVIKNKALDTFDYEEKLINFIMKHGKKSVAKKIYADTLKDIKASGHMNPAVVVRTAIENASPTIMLLDLRVENQCIRDYLKKCWLHILINEQLLKRRKKLIEWLKLIRHLLIWLNILISLC
jgi:hypothetical protein